MACNLNGFNRMTMLKNLRLKNIASLTLGMLFVSNTVNAGGFALNDQSVTFLGNAYAGTSSAIQDASTGYYNPAGLSELKYNQILFSGTYIKKHIELTNGVARTNTGSLITGNNPTKPKSSLMVPAGHFAWRVTEKFSLGFSVIEPFGLDIEYSNTDIARLMSLKDKITTVDFSPTFGYKINRCISVGAGLDILRIDTTISSDVAWADAGPEANGYLSAAGKNWALGYHVGLLLKPRPNTKIGLVYFSHFNPRFTSNVTNSGLVLFPETTSQASYTLNLPDRINVSATQYFGNKFNMMGELEWTHWSRLKTLHLNYNSSALPGIQSFYFQNTWRASLGADYYIIPKLAIKCGVAYDQSPATNTYRSAMIPDADRYLFAVGLKVPFNKYLTMTAGYSYAFYQNTTIAQTGVNNQLNPIPSSFAENLSTLNANVKNSADIFGLQISWNFA